MGVISGTAVTSFAAVVDDYSANVSTTGLLVVGSTAAGSIELAADTDWFKVSLTAGQAYTFGLESARSSGGTLGQGTNAVPSLAVQSPTGTAITTVTNKSASGDPLVSFTPTSSGDYFIAAGGGTTSATGTYTVRASLAAPDDYTATRLTLGTIDAVNGSATGVIERTGDVDWFKITLNKDTNYKFTLSTFKTDGGTLGAGLTSPTLVLYPQEGFVLSQNSISQTSEPTIWFTSWVSGTYYLGVQDPGSGIGSYILRAGVNGPDPLIESVSAIHYSGDARADAILSGSVDWNYLLDGRTTLYYTFDPSAMNIDAHKDTATFNAHEEVAALDILNHVSSVTGIKFVEVATGIAADIHFGIDIHPEVTAPSSSIIKPDVVYDVTTHVMTKYNVDAFIYLNSNTAVEVRDNIAPGSLAYESLLRQIGRALGLGSPTLSGAHAIPTGENSTDFTVMSGVSVNGYKSTFQVDDLLALQWLYGADGLRGKSGLNSTNGPSLAMPDTSPPVVSAISPASGSVDATTATNIVFGFNEDIRKGSGTITLTDVATGTVVESFAADSSPRLNFAGSMLIIDPTADLVGGKTYQVQIPSGVVKDLVGNVYLGNINSNYSFTVAAPVPPTPPVVSYTVSGTLGNDVMVLAAGNSYRGGSGSDTYIVSPSTLSGAVTAAIVDTEGSNVIQFVDNLTVSTSSFFGDAAQLTLSNGAVVQVLGASKFSFQVGANAVSGDAASDMSYAQFAAALGGGLPTGSTPVQGSANFKVPAVFDQAAAPTPAVAGTALTVSGTLGNDILVITAGNNYLGGSGNDSYIVGKNTLAGPVTASITDTEGSNIIQLVDGTVISSSVFLNDAVQLTLSTGAKLQVLGASKFSFQVGANAPGADTAASQSYAQFGTMLGATVPAAGGGAVNGTPDFVVSTGISGGGQIAPQAAEWPALSGVITQSALSEAAASIFSLP